MLIIVFEEKINFISTSYTRWFNQKHNREKMMRRTSFSSGVRFSKIFFFLLSSSKILRRKEFNYKTFCRKKISRNFLLSLHVERYRERDRSGERGKKFIDNDRKSNIHYDKIKFDIRSLSSLTVFRLSTLLCRTFEH